MKYITNLITFFLFFSLLFSLNYIYYANADIVGNRYVCTFENYAVSQKYIDEYAGGNKWLNITYSGTDVDGVYTINTTNNVYGIYDADGVANAYSFINISGTYYNLTFDHYQLEKAGGGWQDGMNTYYYFYHLSTQIAYLRIYKDGANHKIQYDIDGDTATINEGGHDSGDLFQWHIIVTFEYLPTNNSYKFYLENELGISYTYCRASTNVGVINFLYTKWLMGFVAPFYCFYDNMSIENDYLASDIWENDNYLSLGDVSASGIDESTSANNYYLFDYDLQDFNGFSETKTIKQFAIRLPDNLDTTNLQTILVRINDYPLYGYDTIYVDGSDYVIVWENENLTIYDYDLIIEILFIFVAPTTLHWYSYNGDIDYDGDTNYKYSIDAPAILDFDGIVDGDTNKNYDYMYKIWYEYENLSTSEFGNINDYTPLGNFYNCDFTEYQINNVQEHTKQGVYNIHFNGKIYYVDLLISKSDYDDNNNIANQIDLYVVVANDGLTSDWKLIHGASYVVPFTSDWVIFRFNLSSSGFNVPDTFVIFDWYFPYGTTTYAVTQCDINNDAITYFGYGEIGISHAINTQTQLDNIDLGFRFWGLYNSPAETVLPDSITVNPSTINIGYPAKITVTSSDVSVTNSIRIFYWDGSTLKENTSTGFPYEENYKNNFWVSFTPDYVTNYTITLWRNGANVSYAYLNATGTLPNFVVFTSPNPSKNGDSVDIYAYYSQSLSSYEVRIRVENYNKNEYFWIVDNTTLHKVGSTYFYYDGIYDIYLERRINATRPFQILGSVYKHICKSIETSGAISLLYYEKWQEHKDTDMTQIIYFSHNQLGNDLVKIYLNDGYAKFPVGFNTNGEIEYKPLKSGEYKVSLVLESSTGLLYLCDNVTFTVHLYSGEGAGKKDGLEGLLDILGGQASPVKILIGFLIVFLFTLAPLGIGGALKNTDIPTIVYLLSASVGLAFTTAIGLLPIWIPFFILVLAIAYVFITYFYNTFGSKGGT